MAAAAVNRPKRTALDDAMKHVLRNERQRAIRAAKSAWDRQMNAARGEMQRALNRKNRPRDNNVEALVTSTGVLARAVASSWSVTTPIEIRMGQNLSAWTDFHKIDITIPHASVQAVKDSDVERIADTLQMLKGLVYHEVGHIRFTVAPLDALAQLGFGHHPTAEVLGVDPKAYHQAWNLLEDQRMENLVVEESPVIATYFAVMAMHAFFKGPDPKVWLLLMRRPWVPADIRRATRKLCIKAYDISMVKESERLIAAYFAASTVREQSDVVVEFAKLWAELPNSSEHRNGRRATGDSDSNQDQERVEKGAKSLRKQTDPNDAMDDSTIDGDVAGAGNDAPGRGGYEGQADIDTDTSGPATGNGDGDGASNTPPPPGRGHAGHGKGESIQDEIAAITEAIADAVAEKVKELEARNRTADALDAAREVNARSVAPQSLPPHPTLGVLDSEEYAKALAVTSEMVTAFDQAMADRAPSWHRREEQGVLDALAYRTRGNGDTDYWNRWDAGGNTSPDMAVSVILDTSWSMDGHQHHLGAAALSIRLACDQLGLPCTVTTFADRAQILWPAEQAPEPVAVGMCGGTEPTSALDDLQAQRYDKRTHLVVVVTDGEFGDFPGFANWAAPGMSILGVAFGYGHYLEESLVRHGANETVIIDDLAKLPPLVGHFILDHII